MGNMRLADNPQKKSHFEIGLFKNPYSKENRKKNKKFDASTTWMKVRPQTLACFQR